jgi:hypothetical protein
MMSGQGQTVPDIVSLPQVSNDYVRDVIHAFNERGFDALDPKWSGVGRGGSVTRSGATFRPVEQRAAAPATACPTRKARAGVRRGTVPSRRDSRSSRDSADPVRGGGTGSGTTTPRESGSYPDTDTCVATSQTQSQRNHPFVGGRGVRSRGGASRAYEDPAHCRGAGWIRAVYLAPPQRVPLEIPGLRYALREASLPAFAAAPRGDRPRSHAPRERLRLHRAQHRAALDSHQEAADKVGP